MANSFKSYGIQAVGTGVNQIYVAPALTTSTAIGMTVANIMPTTSILVDVILTKGSTNYYIVKGAPIAPGGALVAIGGDQKLVLEAGNKLQVTSNTASSADCIVSVLEIS